MSKSFPPAVEVYSHLTRGVSHAAQIASDGFGPLRIARDSKTRAALAVMSTARARPGKVTINVGNLHVDSVAGYERLGETITFGAGSRTLQAAGDGSATTMILMDSLLGAELIEGLQNGIEPDGIRRGIKRAMGDIARKLRTMSIQITSPDQLIQVANVVSHGDEELANSLKQVFSEYDPEDGFTVELGKRLRTELKQVVRFPSVGHLASVDLAGTSKAAVNARRRQALAAIRATLETGVVPGGGMALLRASQSLHRDGLPRDEQFGYELVLRACQAPLTKIVESAGTDIAAVIEQIRGTGESTVYNAITHNFEDLHESNIIDPAKVSQSALRNAVQAADALLAIAGTGADSSPVPKHATLRQRFLNAGFYSDPNNQPIAIDQPLALDGGSYRLGVNIAEQFWGPGKPDAAFPDPLLKKQFDEHKVLDFDVYAHSSRMSITPQRQPLRLPGSGDSELVFFTLGLTRKKRQAIDVDVLFHGHLIQSRRIEVEVVAHAGDALPPSDLPVQDSRITWTRTAALDRDLLQSLEAKPSPLTIVAERDLAYNSIGLRFYSPAGEQGFQQSTLTDGNLTALMDSVRKQLAATMKAYFGVVGSTEAVLTAQLGMLADVGRSFYRELLPGLATRDDQADNGERLEVDLKPGQTIQVAPLSAQLGVPWELLYERKIESYKAGRIKLCKTYQQHKTGPCPDADDVTVVCPYNFWGYRYIVEQLPGRVDPHKSLPGPLPLEIKNAIPLQLQAIVFAGFTNVDSHLVELDSLGSKEQLKVSPYREFAKIREALSGSQNVSDVIYFYTHGDSKNGSPFLIVGKDEEIHFNDLDAWGLALQNHQPLVVLNACDSAGYSLDQFENLIKFFCDKGAAGVIGTQCTVNELLANAFIVPFFKSFLRSTSAGESLYSARQSLLSKLDPRGLVYSLFAAADVKLAQPVIAPDGG